MTSHFESLEDRRLLSAAAGVGGLAVAPAGPALHVRTAASIIGSFVGTWKSQVWNEHGAIKIVFTSYNKSTGAAVGALTVHSGNEASTYKLTGTYNPSTRKFTGKFTSQDGPGSTTATFAAGLGSIAATYKSGNDHGTITLKRK